MDITHAQFVDEWLPDRNEKWKAHEKETWSVAAMNAGSFGMHGLQQRWFWERYFPEALENFRATVWQQACEVQRKLCATTAGTAVKVLTDTGNEEVREIMARVTTSLIAHIPKITKNEKL